jgi:hypothetical protein
MFHAKYQRALSVFYKNILKAFTIYLKEKSMTPGAGPILTLGLLFEQTW